MFHWKPVSLEVTILKITFKEYFDCGGGTKSEVGRFKGSFSPHFNLGE